MEKSIIKSNKAAILFNTLIIIAICNLIFIIKTELVSEKVASLSLLRNKKEMSFLVYNHTILVCLCQYIIF